MTEWLSAEQAMGRLGVRPQTLYAYVSRGRVRAQPDPREARRSLYRASDIAALTQRKARGRKVSEVAQGAMAWGEPVLTSEISTVVDGRLYYRGFDAVRLSHTETVEGVARLLRGGGVAGRSDLREPPPSGETSRARAFAALAARAAIDPPARGRDTALLAAEAATLLDVLTDAVTGITEGGAIHERLGRRWGCHARGCDLIRRSLVLLADHELNPSTFAARVAASTGASLSAAALAGLATLSGPLHGGVSSTVKALARDALQTGDSGPAITRLAHWRSMPGFGMPGFGHPLYPEGDPRARALLADLAPSAPLGLFGKSMEAATGARANIDFALVALAEALDLPEDAPFALFAVARCAGWTAHAMEQAATGPPIRPRALYVGAEPDE